MKITRTPAYKTFLARLARKAYALGTGRANMLANGEKSLIQWVVKSHAAKTKDPFIWFDVGANKGDYSATVLAECAGLSLPQSGHVFEPIKKSFADLSQNLSSASSKGVTLNNLALSDKAGEITMYFDTEKSSLASIYKREIGVDFGKHETIRATTGAEYVQTKGMQKIHLLKLDVEGHELFALKGFGDFLDAKNIDVIQFEYGGCNLDSHTTLREIYKLLESRGFRIGRLLKDRVELRSYHPLMEDFDYSNYIALGGHFHDHR